MGKGQCNNLPLDKLQYGPCSFPSWWVNLGEGACKDRKRRHGLQDASWRTCCMKLLLLGPWLQLKGCCFSIKCALSFTPQDASLHANLRSGMLQAAQGMQPSWPPPLSSQGQASAGGLPVAQAAQGSSSPSHAWWGIGAVRGPGPYLACRTPQALGQRPCCGTCVGQPVVLP